MIKEICDLLSNIPFLYDLYITTTAKHKATYIKDYLNQYSTATNVSILVVENKGRDVYPFIKQMKPVISNYDYLPTNNYVPCR